MDKSIASDKIDPIAVTVEAGAGPDAMDPKVWKIAAVVCLGPLMSQMDSTVVNVSLSTIRQDLHASITFAQWIISGYLLALALMLPLNGWLVDRVGAKRLYLVLFSAFTVASVLCGAAQTMGQLVAARILQGMAGGLLAPMTQMMIAKVAGRHFARVIGFAAMPVMIAPILGPVLAGAILRYAGWSWLFYINVPIGIVAVFAAYYMLPRDEQEVRRRPFDFLGFLLISPGMVCMLYGVEHSVTGDGYAALVAGLLLIAAFVWHARRKKSAALIDMSMFKIKIFGRATANQFLANGLTYSGQMLVPLYLITGCALSPADAGWMLAPMGLGMLCISPCMGFLTEKFGCRTVSVGGAVLGIVGTLPFIWMIHAGLSPFLLTICLFARGVGQGAIGVPSLSAAYASVPKDKIAVATTALNIVQRLGGPIATTSLAIVMALAATYMPAVGPRAFTVPFIALIGLQLVVVGTASRLPLRIHKK